MIEEREVVPPCRVLWQNGQPVDGELIITERPRITEKLGFIQIPQAPKTQYLPVLKQGPGRPRVANPKKRPMKNPGAGKAWNRADVSVEKILDLQAKGMRAEDIGKELGCTKFTIYSRLRENRRKGPDAAANDAALRVCACGEKKLACKPVCTRCRWRAYQRVHRKKATLTEAAGE